MSGNTEDLHGGGFANKLKAFTRRINPFSKKKNSEIFVKKPNGKWYRSTYRRGVTVEKNRPVNAPPRNENLRPNQYKINKSAASFKKQFTQAVSQTRKAGNVGKYYTVQNGKRVIRTYRPDESFEEEMLNENTPIPANVSPLQFSNFRRRKVLNAKRKLEKLKQKLDKYRRDTYYSLKAFVKAFTMGDLNDCINIISGIVTTSIDMIKAITLEHNYMRALPLVIQLLNRIFVDLLRVAMNIFKRYKSNRADLNQAREELRRLRQTTERLIREGTPDEKAAASTLMPAILTAEQTQDAIEALFNKISGTEHVENLQEVVQSLKENPPPKA